jgi:hypothetical protein
MCTLVRFINSEFTSPKTRHHGAVDAKRAGEHQSVPREQGSTSPSPEGLIGGTGVGGALVTEAPAPHPGHTPPPPHQPMSSPAPALTSAPSTPLFTPSGEGLVLPCSLGTAAICGVHAPGEEWSAESFDGGPARQGPSPEENDDAEEGSAGVTTDAETALFEFMFGSP